MEEEEEENLFVNQINTVQNVSEETNDWLPKRASLSSWSPKKYKKDKKENVIGIYFDLQKAFDVVDHSILLDKLYNYGIRGFLYEWLKNYLCDRTQFTMANGCRSSLGIITHGVPQGSILGPVLFLCYCNDICNAIPESILRLFADDTNLFVHDKNIETLISVANIQLQKLNDWFLANKLSLNIQNVIKHVSHYSQKRKSKSNVC